MEQGVGLIPASAVATGIRQEVAGHCSPSPSKHLLNLLARSRGHLESSFTGQCRVKGKGHIPLPLQRFKVYQKEKEKAGVPGLDIL